MWFAVQYCTPSLYYESIVEAKGQLLTDLAFSFHPSAFGLHQDLQLILDHPRHIVAAIFMRKSCAYRSWLEYRQDFSFEFELLYNDKYMLPILRNIRVEILSKQLPILAWL